MRWIPFDSVGWRIQRTSFWGSRSTKLLTELGAPKAQFNTYQTSRGTTIGATFDP
ncbi:MAG: hypothetical protein WBV40_05640 [Candidatus Cybelea sp.]